MSGTVHAPTNALERRSTRVLPGTGPQEYLFGCTARHDLGVRLLDPRHPPWRDDCAGLRRVQKGARPSHSDSPRLLPEPRSETSCPTPHPSLRRHHRRRHHLLIGPGTTGLTMARILLLLHLHHRAARTVLRLPRRCLPTSTWVTFITTCRPCTTG